MNVADLLDKIALSAPDLEAKVFFDLGPCQTTDEIHHIDCIRIDDDGDLILY